jgi:cobalt-zinc-cadmium efflux system membrane fusion protein
VKTDYRRRIQLAVWGGGIVALLHARTSPAAAEPAPTAAVVDQMPPLPNTVDLSPEALSNLKLHFAKAELRSGLRTITATGVVAFNAKRLAQLSSPSKGRIVSINVAAGDHVRAGKRLVATGGIAQSELERRRAVA